MEDTYTLIMNFDDEMHRLARRTVAPYDHEPRLSDAEAAVQPGYGYHPTRRAAFVSKAIHNINASFFGLYDGHMGRGAAEYCRDQLHRRLYTSQFYPQQLQEAMKDAYTSVEQEFLLNAERTGNESGSTAVTVLLHGDRLVVGHTGDSRVVLSSDGKAVPLTEDHSPTNPVERQRIEREGGTVNADGEYVATTHTYHRSQ